MKAITSILAGVVAMVAAVFYVQVPGLNFYPIEQHLFRADVVLTC